MKTFAEFQKTTGFSEYIGNFDCSDDAENVAEQLGIAAHCALIHEEASDSVTLISAKPTRNLYRVRFWDAEKYAEAKTAYQGKVAFLTTMHHEDLAYAWEGKDYEDLVAMARPIT